MYNTEESSYQGLAYRNSTREIATSLPYLCGASFDVSSEISRWAASWNLPSSYILWNSRYFPEVKHIMINN